MTEDTNQITADHLRAEFLNAKTNWQRWKVLNEALGWAVTASENAAAAREQATELKERIEARAVKAVGRNTKLSISDDAEMVTGVRIRYQGSEETTPEQKTGDYFWSPDADDEDLAGWFVPEENYAVGTARRLDTHHLRVSQGHPAAAELKTRVEGSTAKAAGPEGMPASDDIAARLGFVTPEELARNAWTADTMFTGHAVMQPKEDDR